MDAPARMLDAMRCFWVELIGSQDLAGPFQTVCTSTVAIAISRLEASLAAYAANLLETVRFRYVGYAHKGVHPDVQAPLRIADEPSQLFTFLVEVPRYAERVFMEG